MFWIFLADHIDPPFSAGCFAIFTDFFYGRLDLHNVYRPETTNVPNLQINEYLTINGG